MIKLNLSFKGKLFRAILKLYSWIILILSNFFLFLFFKDIISGGNSYHIHIITFISMLLVSHIIRLSLAGTVTTVNELIDKIHLSSLSIIRYTIKEINENKN